MEFGLAYMKKSAIAAAEKGPTDVDDRRLRRLQQLDKADDREDR